MRSAYRSWGYADDRNPFFGFRLARSVDDGDAPAAPVISSFSASPATITSGGSSALTWSSTGGTAASIDNGVGSVSLSGSKTVSPSVTTTYTLTVTGAGGTRAATTAVTVAAASGEITYTLPGAVPLVMVKIPAGTFQMGSPETERQRDSVETLHQVTLTQDYYMGKYEVTQAQWQAVMGSNPSSLTSCGEDCPVEKVSWDDIHTANGFIEKLKVFLGDTKFRLPTEAEWERAARAGTQTRFSFGDALDGDDNCGANAAANPYVWWCWNAGSTTHAVGTKGANPYGLFDMHGNVYEWVEDGYGVYPTEAQTNPTGSDPSSFRVVRGGSFGVLLRSTRSAVRNLSDRSSRYGGLGFRLARTVDGSGIPDTPAISAFSASPSTITAGGSSTLTWSSTGGTTASIDNGVGAVSPNGLKAVSPSETTTYTLTVTGSGGTAKRQATVTALAGPTISYFTVTPSTIQNGQSATLAWGTTDGATASIDNGVGSVPLSGSKIVSPSVTTNYTLTVTGAGGTGTATTSVTVAAAAGEITYMLPGGVPLVMVKIPAGTFWMGAEYGETGANNDEWPYHEVTLTSDYYIGKYEVTQEQFQAVAGVNRSYFKNCGGDCPVELVSWDDIRGEGYGFIWRLNQFLGTTKFRLPTEAEWERAARGGAQTRFSFGDVPNGNDDCGPNPAADLYAWWCENSGEMTHPVGMKQGNQYGLYDMHGNVDEWVEDWYGGYHLVMGNTDPKGPPSGVERVFRGGSWTRFLRDLRSAKRFPYRAWGSYLGFRLAMSP